MGGSKHFNAKSKRWFISVYWQKKQFTIWRYNGDPIWHEKTADKLLGKIRGEVDDGTFNPRAYQPDSPLSIKQYSEQWLRASQACKNTKRVYKSSIGRAIYFYGPDMDIRHITHSKLLGLYAALPLSEKGKYNVLTALKTMLRMAYKDELIKKVPPFPRLSMGLPQEIKYLSQEQQAKVLAAIPERHRPIFELMCEYGLRPGEARALKWDCVTDTEITIRRAISDNALVERTKTGETRVYGITGRAREILRDCKRQTPFASFVFCHNSRGTPYRGEVLNSLWKTSCGGCGINIGLYNGVRHSRAGQLLDAGHPYEVVSDVLGHSTVTMTRSRYCHRSKASITAILEGMVIPFERKDENNG